MKDRQGGLCFLGRGAVSSKKPFKLELYNYQVTFSRKWFGNDMVYHTTICFATRPGGRGAAFNFSMDPFRYCVSKYKRAQLCFLHMHSEDEQEADLASTKG